MKDNQIYFNAKLFHKLKTFLPLFADRVTAAGEVMRKHFPSIPWNTRTLWLVCGETSVRAYLCDQINRQEAKQQKRECEWGRREPGPGYIDPETSPLWRDVAAADVQPEPLSPKVKRNRRFVMDNTRPDREAIMCLAWNELSDAFLRTSVVSVSDKGKTVVSRDADALLRDFCTLYAETKEQRVFVQLLEKVRADVPKVAVNLTAAAAVLPATSRLAFSSVTSSFLKNYSRVELAQGGRILLSEDYAIPRALITYFRLASSVLDAPKFYNRAGYWAYQPDDVKAITGSAGGSVADMKQRVPELYGKPCTSKDLSIYPSLPVEE